MLLNLTLVLLVFVFLLLPITFFNQVVVSVPVAIIGPYTNSARKGGNLTKPRTSSHLVTLNLETFHKSKVILSGNDTISSEGGTFRVGFFAPDDESTWYLGIYYASIPIPTYVWVANRERPIKNPLSAALVITEDGKLAVIDQESRTLMWHTNNAEKGSDLRLLEQGNLVLLSSDGTVVWQSFDFPTDTWLPGMNLTAGQMLTSWKSSVDPSPGRYSLRLNPPNYGEIALVYYINDVDSAADDSRLFRTYWTSGVWNGNAFSDIPEMTVAYIYKFNFLDPFTPMATFGYTEVPLETGTKPPLTRFVLHHMGQLRQFTWSQQIVNWNMFWSQPDNICRVYSLCGNLGFCNGKPLSPCQCLNVLNPMDRASWDKGDFSKGCMREGDESSCKDDLFEDVGVMNYERTIIVSFSASRSDCESSCLKNCSCLGFLHNDRDNMCKNVYGSLLNLRNLTSDAIIQDRLYLRVQSTEALNKNKKKNSTLLIGVAIGILVIATSIIGTTVNLLYLRRRRKVRERRREEVNIFQVSNLRFFTYKELHAITRGFSEKLGHGGFGAVFLGKLPDSSMVAVKRLERPGGGEQEFRAEVRTIGNIQHVNLVRLRGFCSEKSHRLLAYDYMPNGPLSTYLKRGGPNLSWDVRFRVAIGTARGIAYLHEECRNRIIHCDIKPENILLDEDFSAKVSDFGLAKLIGRDFSRIIATMRGTWGYVAPEWISGVAITTKADVYSYGMTMLELLGGRRNVEANDRGKEEGDETEKWFFPPYASVKIIERKIEDIIDERLGGVYSREEAEWVGMVAIWCIQDDETTRPSMGTVVKMLEGVVEVAVPPPPKLLQALVSGESFRGVVVDSGNRAVQEEDDGGGGDVDVDVSVSKGSKDSETLA